MSKPRQIEAAPPQGREDARPPAPPQRLVHQVVVDPEEIYPKETGRQGPFSFEVIVSRYILLSAVAVLTIVLLLVLSEFLFRR